MLNKILFALIVPVAAFAQVVCTFPEPPATSKQPEVPGIQAFRMTKAPVIDGKLDDEAWKGAPVLKNFVWLRRLGNVKLQSFANQKIDEQSAIPVSQQTKVLLGYGPEKLYIAFQCDEARMNEIVANEESWSSYVWQDDCVQVMLQGAADKDTKHWHLILSANNAVSVSYNNFKSGAIRRVAVEHAVVRGEKGWTAEIAIPYASFGEKYPADGTQWRMNFLREEHPFKEVSSWSETLDSFHETERFGRVYFGSSNSAEIAVVDWDEIFPGSNQLKVTVQNTSAKEQKVKLRLTLDDTRELAAKEVMLPPGKYSDVNIGYELDKSDGELQLNMGRETLRKNFAARKLTGTLESSELINPAESIDGNLELPVSRHAIEGLELQWYVDGVKVGAENKLRGRSVNFHVKLPELEPGTHQLQIKMLKKGTVTDSLTLPFAILPGLFDEI